MMKTSIAVLAVAPALALGACVPSLSLEGAPCPCASGFSCCKATQLCVSDLIDCSAPTYDGGQGDGAVGDGAVGDGAAGDGARSDAAGSDGAGTDAWHQDAGNGDAAVPLLVSAGEAHTCAIKPDRSLWCWGANDNGQLGTPAAIECNTPTVIASAMQFRQLSAGHFAHTCAVTTSGALYCWGANDWGQLGLADEQDRDQPVQVDNTRTWLAVAAGTIHTCAIDVDHRLLCWGHNSRGELGNNDASGNERNFPGVVDGDHTDWQQASVGTSHSCAIRNGQLWCWGDNMFGQVGVGSGDFWIVPRPVNGDSDWSKVSAGEHHTCGIKGAGELWCWGDNGHGQVGDGSSDVEKPTPVRISASETWVDVAGGNYHTCAVTTGGAVWCWGANNRGQLGRAPGPDEHSPVPFVSARFYLRVAAGESHTCLVAAPAVMLCFGSNSAGQLGGGAGGFAATPQQVAGGNWTAVAASEDFSLGIQGNGAVQAWGFGIAGVTGSDVWHDSKQPTELAAGSWTQVGAGGLHACMIASDGTLWCLGRNESGQLGLGDTATRLTAVQELHRYTDWSRVAPGSWHTCALRGQPGGAYCWGNNTYGEAGSSPGVDVAQPTQIGSATDWSRIGAGTSHSCGIRSGTLLCWGRNYDGQLGNGSNLDRSSPGTVNHPTGGSWSEVDCGGAFSCAIDNSGALWCWGDNYGGQIGIDPGTTASVNEPSRVGSATGWQLVSCGGASCCATQAPGSLWCWGLNDQGQLGLGDHSNRFVPGQVASDSDWIDVQVGSRHACSRRADRSLWCWGDDETGQLGDGASWTDLPVIVFE